MIAAGAVVVAHAVPVLSAPLLAVAAGAALASWARTRQLARSVRPLAGGPMRLSIALLGLQVSAADVRATGPANLALVLATVAVTWSGTRALATRLGFTPPQGLLVAAGFSICGASAVAAMEPRSGARQGDSALAVALVTLCGSLAIVVLPLLRTPLGLSPEEFGVWVGASVHDVGQVAATAGPAGAVALVAALVVKLSRVALLAPLVAWQGRRSPSAPGGRAWRTVPWFLVAFVAAVALRSTDWLPLAALDAARLTQQALLALGLVGLGASIRVQDLRGLGRRAVVLGLAAWLLVAGTSYLLLLVLRGVH